LKFLTDCLENPLDGSGRVKQSELWECKWFMAELSAHIYWLLIDHQTFSFQKEAPQVLKAISSTITCLHAQRSHSMKISLIWSFCVW